MKINTTLQLSEYQLDNDFSKSKQLVNEAFLLLEKSKNNELSTKKH